MHPYLLEMLQCPACHGDLAWDITLQQKNLIETAEATCETCNAVYPVQESIAVFLTPDLPRKDLWEAVDSGLIKYLRLHPEIEKQLLNPPPNALNPADQFFRALVLEERGDYVQAKRIEETAFNGLYTTEYLACQNKQIDFMLEQLTSVDGPIVDLASGRCYLVEKLAQKLTQPIIASDFSLSVLRRNRRRLETFGLYKRVSLLAFDARRTPFKNGAVKTLTTNLGLPNIEEPARLPIELRRIVGGTFLAISHFYPEDDGANAAVTNKLGLSTYLYRHSTLEAFTTAGWQVELANLCRGSASPTPKSAVLEGASIDALPAEKTTLEWCTLVGT